jgi:1,4-dihydroxy-2-naphthoate octaprenyltransferase
MTELVNPVGLGLASRGSVDEAIVWAGQARQNGLHSIWFHDTPYERDAVTYAATVASHVPDIHVALGTLSVYTRHPVLTAMTISALDEVAPGRIIVALGTSLPLRLAQLGIPYTPDQGVARVSDAIDNMRALWAGQRVTSAAPSLPPIQPMFPPVHRTPIYIAAYRTDFLKLAGAKADGYLARPAESIANLKRLLPKMVQAASAAGRSADTITTAGYLLTHVDKSRREALNRAKREPFVIYMMSVLSNFALCQAGFEPDLRDRIAAAWRAEDYHAAARLIPDEMLDAFMLTGTREEVAEGVQRFHDAGMNIPVLQPVLQEDAQVEAVLDAAVLYGSASVARAGAPVPAEVPLAVTSDQPDGIAAARARLDDEQLNVWERAWRRVTAWYEICRPFSLTGSTVPVAAAGALALINGEFNLPLFLAALLGALLLQMGTNVINEIYDVRHGIDTITSPRASQALLKGRLTERDAFRLVTAFFALAILIGLGLTAVRGWPVAVFGLIGLIAGWGYTAPPLQLKYRALGIPLVFLMLGPLMVVGAYYVVTGVFSGQAVVVSIPVGLLVAAILHGNEWRDIADDARYGIGTVSTMLGRRAAYFGYVGMIVGAYLVLALAVMVKALPATTLLVMLSLPLLVRAIHESDLGALGQQRAIAKIDLETAQLHAAFGALLVLGLVLASLASKLVV